MGNFFSRKLVENTVFVDQWTKPNHIVQYWPVTIDFIAVNGIYGTMWPWRTLYYNILYMYLHERYYVIIVRFITTRNEKGGNDKTNDISRISLKTNRNFFKFPTFYTCKYNHPVYRCSSCPLYYIILYRTDRCVVQV